MPPRKSKKTPTQAAPTPPAAVLPDEGDLSADNAISSRPKHTWTPPQVSFLLHTLFVEVTQGKRSGGAFKPEAWNSALKQLNTKFGLTLEVLQIKSKMNVLKCRFNITLHMKELSGWGWDDATCTPTNSPQVVAQHIKTLPKEKQLIARGINLYSQPDFEMMSALFLGTMATGKLAKGSNAAATTSAPMPAATAAATTSAPTPAATATASTSAPTPAATATASTSPPDDIYTQMLAQQPTPCPTCAAAGADVTPASKAPVYGAQFPLSNQASWKRKDATENNTPVGERPNILNALTPGPDPVPAPTCPPPPPPTKPDDYASLTSRVQVALAVVKKLHRIFKLYNGKRYVGGISASVMEALHLFG
ncbi:hypothetical protein HDU77_003858 [Chytriomyces hyalinus]|nr:hypothetical protein HDU77_003858 [Chytriomyces hyalinus]